MHITTKNVTKKSSSWNGWCRQVSCRPVLTSTRISKSKTRLRHALLGSIEPQDELHVLSHVPPIRRARLTFSCQCDGRSTRGPSACTYGIQRGRRATIVCGPQTDVFLVRAPSPSYLLPPPPHCVFGIGVASACHSGTNTFCHK